MRTWFSDFQKILQSHKVLINKSSQYGINDDGFESLAHKQQLWWNAPATTFISNFNIIKDPFNFG